MKPTAITWLATALVAFGLLARPAAAIDIPEVRGDFYYDADGKLIGHRNAELPEGLERRPMSHREKFELMGLELPTARLALEPRNIVPKPTEIQLHDGLMENIIIFKFYDSSPVRLRNGHLTQSASAIEALMADHAGAQLERAMGDTPEYIHDENRETGQLISGKELQDLNNFYVIRLPEGSDGGVEIANALLSMPEIETAYLQSKSDVACADIAPTTPEWTANQFFHRPAPMGIDVDYAKAYHAGGDGYGSSYWVMDLENDWCLTHEDYDFDVTDVVTGLIPTGDPVFLDHGTAVLGVLGACDNGYGMNGITPDVSLKAADFSTGTRAATIATADSWLVAGEVMLLEIHITGPVSGDICSCSCTQFELVPVEWDDAAFASIQTATANGVIVVEAAGNGSMDLDDARYLNKFQRWFRDSGAILVGASLQNHVPSCYSGYGSRLDLHSLGSSVFTTGYGFWWNSGTACDQDYMSAFGGTSSASAIIAGACSSLQGIAKAKYGVTLTPAQMLDYLLVGATPQAEPLSVNIGPMPNLAAAITALQPDLVPYAPGGWDYPVVPRVTSNSTAGNVPLGAGPLLGNIATTFWNASMRNQDPTTGTTQPSDLAVYVDDQITLASAGGAPLVPLQHLYFINAGPTTVKVGRHTVRNYADWQGTVPEDDETNNDYARQFIWGGVNLAANTPTTRTGTPYSQTSSWGPWFNAEGFGGATGSNYWHAFAVMPDLASEDFDVRLNTEIPGNVPQAGFGAYETWSSDSDGLVDFVVLNRNNVPSGTYYASALNNEGPFAGHKHVEFDEDKGLLALGSNGAYSLVVGELINMHEVFLTAGTPYRVQVEWLGGSADYGIATFSESTTYANKLSGLNAGFNESGSATEDKFVVVTPSVTGYHGVAIWKKGSADVDQTLSYNVILDTQPNLLGNLTLPGWYGPIVPRNTTDATGVSAPLPAVLNGNVATTSFNFITHNEGAGVATTPWTTELTVNDQLRAFMGGGTLAAGVTQFTINSFPGVVQGGRSHVRTNADYLAQLAEFDELDNDFVDWFVWSPRDMTADTPLSLTAPPTRNPLGFGPWPSSDGLRGTITTFWGGVATLPGQGVDDVDIRLHQPSTGSKDGFGSYEAWSAAVGPATDIALVNRNVIGGSTFDFGVVEYGTTGNYHAEFDQALYLGPVLAGTTTFGTYQIESDEIWDLYEFYVDGSIAGAPLHISLDNLTGAGNLNIALWHSATTTYDSKLGADVYQSVTGPGADEHMPPQSLAEGFYALAVFKNGVPDVGLANAYRLVLSTSQVVAAPVVEHVPTEFALQTPRPNPFRSAARIHYDVPANGGELYVEVYDLTGRRIVTLVDGPQPAGRHTVNWDGRDAGGRRAVSGVYFVRLRSAARTETRKITLLR